MLYNDLLSSCRSLLSLCRGDVGSWVREAALEALSHTVPLAAKMSSEMDAESPLASVVPNTVAACLQQAVERIARVREARTVSFPEPVSQRKPSSVLDASHIHPTSTRPCLC